MIGTKLAVAAALLGASAAPAATHGAAPVLYRLDAGATYQTGCFAPCLCPVLPEAPVVGTFELTPGDANSLFHTYDIGDIDWTAHTAGTTTRITGSATYRIGGEVAVEQEMDLALSVGGKPEQKFSSGVVVGGSNFPEISLPVSIHGGVCADSIIKIVASPVPPHEIRPYDLGHASAMQRGCFGPCACAIMLPQPLAGSMSLVELEHGDAQSQYAVVGMRWHTVSPLPAPAATTIRGHGLYTIAGATARLMLELAIGDGDPASYDSGEQSAAGFPLIDARISQNGGVCFDTVIDVHAAPRRGALPR